MSAAGSLPLLTRQPAEPPAGLQSHKLYALANQTATEAFSSIRTVAAFSLGPHLSAQYRRAMRAPSKSAVAKSNTAGASFGASQFILYASYGACCPEGASGG